MKEPKKHQIRNSTAEFLIFSNQAHADSIEVASKTEPSGSPNA